MTRSLYSFGNTPHVSERALHHINAQVNGTGAGIAGAGGNRLAPDKGSGTAGAAAEPPIAIGSGIVPSGGCIIIPPATGGGGSGRSSAGPSVANASIGVWVRVSVYWQRTGSNLRGRQPSAE